MSVPRPRYTVPMNVKVPLHPGEPSYSLLLRTSVMHGRTRIWTMFQRSGLDGGGSVADLDPAFVAFLCNHAENSVRAASPTVTPAGARILSDEVKRTQFSVQHRRWCSACLAQSDHHRVWWDLPAFVACPEHGIRISEACGCDRRPRWKKSFPTRCSKHHDFRLSPKEQATAAELGLSAFVRDRLMGERHGGPQILSPAPTLGDALDLLNILGLASLSARGGTGPSPRGGGRGAIATEGFRIASDWPASGIEMLDRLIWVPEELSIQGWGLARAYGPFYSWLKKAGSTPLHAPVRALLIEHARRNVRRKPRTRILGVDVPNWPGVTSTQAAARWGVSFERFRRVATAMGLLPDEDMRGRPAWLRESSIQDLAPVIRDARTRDQVAAELGIAPHVCASLIRAGIVPSIVDGRSGREKGLNVWLLPPTAASGLMDRLSEIADAGKTDGIAPESLPFAARNIRVPLSDLLSLVFEGRIRVRTIDPKAQGLHRFGVSVSEAKLAARRWRFPGLTLSEAAAALGWPEAMLTNLRNAGELAAVRHGHFWVLEEAEVDRLRTAYVSTKELGKLLGTGVPVVATMSRQGVQPRFSRPEFHKVLFDRAAATAAVERHRAMPVVQVPEPRAGWLTRHQAAARMGVERALVTQLVEAGLVAADCGPYGYAIDPQVADTFHGAFAGSTELAMLLGKGSGLAATVVLAKAGIVPRCDRPAFLSALYPRHEATAAIEAHIERERLAAVSVRQRQERVESGAMLTSKQVMAKLGVTDTMLAQLGRATHLEPALAPRRHGRDVLYDGNDVEAFAAVYVTNARIDELPEVAGMALEGNAATKLLLKLGVQPVCERPAFYSFLFRRAEAREALAHHLAAVARERSAEAYSAERRTKRYTLREVLRILGIDSKLGSALVRAGLLQAEVTPSVTLIEPVELVRFRRKYMLANEVSELVGRPSIPGTKLVVDGLGIFPVKTSEPLPTSVYDRAEVEEKVGAWRRNPALLRPKVREATGELRAFEVRYRLGCNDSLVKRIVDEGLLHARIDARDVVVTEAALARFRSRYALASEFTVRMGVRHTKAVSVFLDRAGVAPVRAEPPFSPKLYLRAEVEAALP